MKKIIYILGICFFCLSSFKTEEIDIYSVIKVMGSILHTENGKSLYTGDKVRSNEKLNFKSDQSKAAVISSKKGRFILTSSTTASLGLMPAMNNVSSRAGGIVNAMDLQKHFEGDYLILPDYSIEINETSFPMNDLNFFFLRYTYNGESISKKLNFEGNRLKINASEILKIDNKTISLENNEMLLYYRNSTENTSTKLANFNAVFPDIESLKIETKIILNEFAEKENTVKMTEITAYLNENYGKAHSENLAFWLKNNFDL